MAEAEGKPISKTTAIIVVLILIIAILAGVAGWLAIGPVAAPEEVEHPIGLAIAVSGPYETEGPYRRDAALLAIEHMNDLLEDADSPVSFVAIHEDSKGTAEGALAAFEALSAAGVKVVVGPLSSGEVGAIKSFADANKIVSVSPSSTSLALAVPDDYIFRMPPTDIPQSKALSQLVDELGYTKVAILARNDDYGKGITDMFEDLFTTQYGGTVEKLLYTTGLADYGTEVDLLSSKVAAFGAGADRAVLVIAFDTDGLNIFGHARIDPVLSGVEWFGSESLKRPTFLPPEAPDEIGDFLLSVELTGLFASPARNPATVAFEEAYKARWDKDPTPYSYFAYDAAWVAMQAVLTAATYDGEAVASVLPRVCSTYLGASGYKKLDENGDVAGADYVVWKVEGPPAAAEWGFDEIGVWSFTTEELTFY